MDREVLSWEAFDDAAQLLAQDIARSGYRPDIILAIARGGLLVAGVLAYALSVKNVYVMNVAFYTDVDERMPFPVVLPPPLNLVDLKDARLLIADDVADTGHTIRSVYNECQHHVAEIRTAVLYEKRQSLVKCEYVGLRTDRWISFPWSSRQPVVGSKSAEQLVGEAEG